MLNRRDFLVGSGAALALLAAPKLSFSSDLPLNSTQRRYLDWGLKTMKENLLSRDPEKEWRILYCLDKWVETQAGRRFITRHFYSELKCIMNHSKDIPIRHFSAFFLAFLKDDKTALDYLWKASTKFFKRGGAYYNSYPLMYLARAEEEKAVQQLRNWLLEEGEGPVWALDTFGKMPYHPDAASYLTPVVTNKIYHHSMAAESLRNLDQPLSKPILRQGYHLFDQEINLIKEGRRLDELINYKFNYGYNLMELGDNTYYELVFREPWKKIFTGKNERALYIMGKSGDKNFIKTIRNTYYSNNKNINFIPHCGRALIQLGDEEGYHMLSNNFEKFGIEGRNIAKKALVHWYNNFSDEELIEQWNHNHYAPDRILMEFVLVSRKNWVGKEILKRRLEICGESEWRRKYLKPFIFSGCNLMNLFPAQFLDLFDPFLEGRFGERLQVEVAARRVCELLAGIKSKS
jgi:hypothetical protein